MISYKSGNDLSDLLELCRAEDVCACRIFCLASAYGRYDDIVKLWLQSNNDGIITAAISCYGSDMTVYAANNADLSEITEFAAMTGFASMTSNIALYSNSFRGIVMKLNCNVNKNPLHRYILPDEIPLHEIWQIMKDSEGEDFAVPEYEDFLLDVSHRMRHGACICEYLEDDCKVISFAMTTALSDTSAVIGAVCTAPEFRNKGFGSICLSRLKEKLNGKAIMLMRTSDRNSDFYLRSGFCDSGEFYTYIPG